MKVQEIPETGTNAMEQEIAGAQDTIYLCNFRVSVDGEWLCLKELQDVEFNMQDSVTKLSSPSPDVPVQPFGMQEFYGFPSWQASWVMDRFCCTVKFSSHNLSSWTICVGEFTRIIKILLNNFILIHIKQQVEIRSW